MSSRPRADHACPRCLGDGGRFVVSSTPPRRSRWEDCEVCGGTGTRAVVTPKTTRPKLTDRGFIVANLAVIVSAWIVGATFVDWRWS